MDITLAAVRTALQTVGHGTLYAQFMRMDCPSERDRLLGLLRQAAEEREAVTPAPVHLQSIPGGRA